MSKLMWDEVSKRYFETGVDRGVLFLPDNAGNYTNGVAWSGLTSVSESPSGAEPNAQYADNIKYLNLFSAEEWGATIEAFMYPDEFARFDGLAVPTPGVTIGQQARPTFGLAYRTLIGNDTVGQDFGYKLHLAYGCQASPSEKAYSTVNDSPEPMTLSWAITTTPVPVTGLKPTSIITIDSTRVSADALQALEQILYGAPGVDPMLPLPDTIISMFGEGVVMSTPVKPVFDEATDTITIPTTLGVEYIINDVVVPAGAIVITVDTLVSARPASGYVFTTDPLDADWLYEV